MLNIFEKVWLNAKFSIKNAKSVTLFYQFKLDQRYYPSCYHFKCNFIILSLWKHSFDRQSYLFHNFRRLIASQEDSFHLTWSKEIKFLIANSLPLQNSLILLLFSSDLHMDNWLTSFFFPLVTSIQTVFFTTLSF